MNNKVIENRGTSNPELIKETEKLVNKKFPKKFIDIVSLYDRPILEKEFIEFCYNKGENRDITSLGIIFSFDDSYPYERFVDTVNNPPEFFPEGLIAFGRDGSGNLFCFDYRQNPETDNPPIVLWLHEEEENEGIVFLSNSFDEFIDSLKSEEEVGLGNI